MEKLNGQDIGPDLEEVETGQRPELKDIVDRSPTYKSYGAQWKSLAVRNGKLERH
jgi:cell envelope opacity-associated protein A